MLPVRPSSHREDPQAAADDLPGAPADVPHGRHSLMVRDYSGYKGRSIEVISYPSEGGKWRPTVKVITQATGSQIHDQGLVVPGRLSFDTEIAADDYGYQLAMKWIDEH